MTQSSASTMAQTVAASKAMVDRVLERRIRKVTFIVALSMIAAGTALSMSVVFIGPGVLLGIAGLAVALVGFGISYVAPRLVSIKR